MKRLFPTIFALAAIAAFLVLSCPASADTTGWPKTSTVNGYQITAYQPQADTWDSYRVLKARMAVSILQPGAKTPVVGVVNLMADTIADDQTRAVQVYNIQETSINFPGLTAAQSQKLENFIKANYNFPQRVVPMDTILLSLQQGQQNTRQVQIDTTPPQIFYSDKPAILISYDGDPLFSPIKGGPDGLQFAVNTNWNVFLVKSSSTYYLLDTDHWLQARSATGPWSPAGALPAIFQQLPAEDNWDTARAQLNASPIAASQMPTVWVATKPALAIVTGGPPKLSAISGTQLQYATNANQPVFFYKGTNLWYFLTAGRWFSASSLNGPWTFAGNSLPADFKKIPPNSEMGWVLPSVPNTPEAQEAIMRSQIPQTASVNRSTTITVTYSGDPNFQPIPGTTLRYAVNTNYDVIATSSNAYYACYSGVWYTASSPNGPWSVATNVPSEIYSIPSSSPLYPDTYVTVESSTASAVVFGFTAGYLLGYPWYGGYYYGTGFYYPPYYGGFYGGYPAYYGYPYTYASQTAYYNPATGNYAHGYQVSGPYGSARTVSGYNPSTGNYYHGGAVNGPYGGAGHASVYNPATGQYYHGSAAYGPNGAVTCHGGSCTSHSYSSTASTNPYHNYSSSEVKPQSVNVNNTYNRSTTNTSYNKPTTSTYNKPTTSGSNDLYAGKDGNVYKPTSSGGWQQYDNHSGSWNNAAASHPSTTAGGWSGASSLNRDQYARSAGSQSFGGYNGGGSSFRGGGGFRGR